MKLHRCNRKEKNEPRRIFRIVAGFINGAAGGSVKMGLCIEEQETHINFMRGDERAMIYTSDSTTMTKLNKLVELEDTEWKLESVFKLKDEVIGKTYSCPVSFISFRSKRIKREYTEEQRKNISDRLRKIDSTSRNSTSVL